MLRVTDQVDATYLEQPAPRPVSLSLALSVLNEHAFEQPLKVVLNPLLILSVLALIALVALRASPSLRLIAALLIAGQLALDVWQIWRRARDDLALLRNGLTIRAHVLGLRPYRTTTGEIDGALLDCAIPVAPRRTYVGSIWLADGVEALRLAHRGRVEVICLPRTPGTWRVIEDVRSDIRYERMGAMQAIPHEA